MGRGGGVIHGERMERGRGWRDEAGSSIKIGQRTVLEMANKRVRQRQRMHPAVISEQAADTVEPEHTHTERVGNRRRLMAVKGHAYTLLYVLMAQAKSKVYA